jgi:proteic killer suppression protein
VIKSFKSSEAESIFHRQPVIRLKSIGNVALRRLRNLDSVVNLMDLQLIPGNHLEKLKGDRTGQYSIRINDQYRICFEWVDGDAYNIEITDYH